MPRVSPRAALLTAGGAIVVLPLACGRIGYELESERASGERTTEAGADAGSGGTGGRLPDATPGQLLDAGSGGSGHSPDSSLPASTDGGRAITDAASATDGAASTSDGGTADAGGDAATQACRPTGAAPDYCQQIPALPATPVIDGVLDCGLTLRALVPQGWTGPSTIPADASAEYAVAYRPDGLYFYVVVRDSTRIPPKLGDEAWRGDGVELYVDSDGVYAAAPAFDDPGTRQVEIAAPVDSQTPSRRAQLYVWQGARTDWTSSSFIAVPTADGYAVEALVTAPDLGIPSWTLSQGARVGMDLAVNVSDPTTGSYATGDGYRLGQYFLNVTTGSNPPPFSNVSAFCAPTLGR
jgi:hypothetical protein